MDGPGFDAVILTALPVEETALARSLGRCSRHTWRGRDLHVGEVGGLRVLVFPMDGMGNVGSAEVTARVIAVWNPSWVLLVGIAGGARSGADDLHYGDVLVPDQVIGYEQAKVQPGAIDRRYEVYRPHSDLLTAARGLVPTDWASAITTPHPGGSFAPRAHVGPVFAGEKVVADPETVRELRSAWPKAIGIEMEGLGVALASYRGGPGFLMVKAVSDFADTAKNDDWHTYAAEAAARFAVAVLRKAPLRPDPDRPQAIPITAPAVFPGRVKLHMIRQLHDDWEDLADAFDVPRYAKARFRPGNEPRDLWEWLDIRGKLPALPDMLTVIGLQPLADYLRIPPSQG